jgi:hypothetical protein
MLPNQGCREDGEETASATCSRGSLRCEQRVAGLCSATAVLQTEAAPSGLRFQTDEDVQEEVKRWLRL